MSNYSKKAIEKMESQRHFLNFFIEETRKNITAQEEEGLEKVLPIIEQVMEKRAREKDRQEKPRAVLIEELKFWVRLAKETKVPRRLLASAFIMLRSRGMDFILLDMLADGIPGAQQYSDVPVPKAG